MSQPEDSRKTAIAVSQNQLVSDEVRSNNARQMEHDFGESGFKMTYADTARLAALDIQEIDSMAAAKKPPVVLDRVILRKVVSIYCPTSSMSKLLKEISFSDTLDLSDLRIVLQEKKYPEHWIQKVFQTLRAGKKDVSAHWKQVKNERRSADVTLPSTKQALEIKYDSNGKPIRPEVVEAKDVKNRSKAALLKHNPQGLGVAAPVYWRVPKARVETFCSRPTVQTFTVARFKMWITSVAARLQKHIVAKNEFISADDFSRSLYKGTFAGSKKALADLLPKCSVYLARYKDEPTVSNGVGFIVLSRKDVSKMGESPFLEVSGIKIASLVELSEIEGMFRKHKPLFRACMRFFSGELDQIGTSTLQRELHSKFPRLYEGNTPSVDINVKTPLGEPGNRLVLTHEVVFPGLDEILTALNYTSGGSDTTRRVVQVGSLLTALASARSWLSAISAVLQFVSGNDFLWGFLNSAFRKIRLPHATYQNSFFSTEFKEAIRWPAMKEFFTVTVTGIISHVFSEISETVAGFVPSVMNIVMLARVEMMKDAAKSLAAVMLSTINEVVLRVRRCVETRSLSPLWGEDWDPRRWVKSVEAFITHYATLTATGADSGSLEALHKLAENSVIPSWYTAPKSLGDFMELCEAYYEQGKKMVAQFRISPDIVRELTGVLHRLRVFIDTLHSAVNASNERIQPFMLMFWGPPGTGKSNLSAMITQAIGRKNNYDVSPSGRYIWQEGVNFQDGLSHIQWAVHMDDVDQSVAKDQAGSRNFVQNVIALVNNCPMPVEAAAVDMKGKLRASPRLVTYCTNFPNGNLKSHTLQPNAFWRRVGLRINVLAKEEFSKGKGVLDVEKALASETYDMYDFVVSEFDPTIAVGNNAHVIPFKDVGTLSFDELMALIHKKYDAHVERQLALLSSRAGDTKGFCPTCGMLVGKQKCGHFEDKLAQVMYQGGVSSRAIGDCRRRVIARYSETAARIDYLIENLNSISMEKLGKLMAKAALVAVAVACMFTYYQGRSGNAADGLHPNSWWRAAQEFIPGLPPPSVGATFTKEELDATIAHSLVAVEGSVTDGWGMIVSQNVVMFPVHYVKSASGIEYGKMVKFTIGGRMCEAQLTQLNSAVLPSNCEIIIMRVGELKGTVGILGKMWTHDSKDLQSFDEVEVRNIKLVGSSKSNGRIHMVEGVVWRINGVPTTYGDCGAVYVGRHGTSWKIVGMHYQRLSDLVGGATIGAIITQDETKKVIAGLGAVYQGVVTCTAQLSREPETVEFSPYPVKSEVWVAMTQGAQVYGFGEVWPPMKGSTMKTKMQWSIIRDDVAFLEERFCGVTPYWGMPDFRGQMVENIWQSPFTLVFKHQNRGVPNQRAMWLALADYLAGAELLDRQGWRSLSEVEVVKGVPGSYVHAMNLKTSVGPPYNQSKRNHFSVTADDVFMSPEVTGMFDELTEILKNHVPAAVGICTLKDEPLKPLKKPRVFTCLSASYNMLLKQKLSPVKSFMRAHRTFFESWVGVDMTSREAGELVAFLAAMDPKLTRLEDKDAEKLDKSYNGEEWDFVGLVFYALAWLLGLDAFEILRLLNGIKHCRYVIKGDVFSMFWNPSGHDATVECNGVLVSLGERYVHYRTTECLVSDEMLLNYVENFFVDPVPKFAGQLHFRDDVALATYGDDSIRAVRPGLVVPDNYLSIWKDEFGIVMTDADKSGKIRFKSISEVQFLKRRFVWSAEYMRYLTPLDPRSLVRTLVIKRESILTLRDHACVAMSEVLRETVYHGRDLYEELLDLFKSLVAKHDLAPNMYLRIFEYEHWHVQLLAGTFKAWVPRSTTEEEMFQGNRTPECSTQQ